MDRVREGIPSSSQSQLNSLILLILYGGAGKVSSTLVVRSKKTYRLQFEYHEIKFTPNVADCDLKGQCLDSKNGFDVEHNVPCPVWYREGGTRKKGFHPGWTDP